MKKNALFLFIIPVVILSQSCKKSSSADTTPTPVFQAYIGSPVWTPDTVSASITYNATAKTKVFTCGGVKDQKKIDITLTDPTPEDNSGITLGTYNVTANSNVLFTYSIQKKNTNGEYVFESFGTVQPGSGTLTISAVDTDAKTITGTFSFTSSKTNYDENGGIISVNLASVTAGTITKMPYTFKRE
ncbi:MAG: DUF6252 family protein [Mucilaginibacter sp.]|uniref:DUF6252 family protein n=1 Tax=Mucilaginibacter sp. TaxID=1882438 RepID=UPI0035641E25